MSSSPTAGARLLAAETRLAALDGVTITLTHSGTAATVRARVSPLAPGTRYKYFISAQSRTWAAPAFLAALPGDYAPIAVGDPVMLPTGMGDAATGYTVRGIEKRRAGDVVYRTMLFIARDAP